MKLTRMNLIRACKLTLKCVTVISVTSFVCYFAMLKTNTNPLDYEADGTPHLARENQGARNRNPDPLDYKADGTPHLPRENQGARSRNLDPLDYEADGTPYLPRENQGARSRNPDPLDYKADGTPHLPRENQGARSRNLDPLDYEADGTPYLPRENQGARSRNPDPLDYKADGTPHLPREDQGARSRNLDPLDYEADGTPYLPRENQGARSRNPDPLDYNADGTPHLPRENQGTRSKNHWNNKNEIPHLAVVICGDRFDEPMTMLKSAVLFTNTFLVIHVIADSEILQQKVKTELESWPSDIRSRIKYNIYNTSFPADVSCENCEGLKWQSLFRPCSAQRLFLSDILKDVDSVLYVDADALFLAPIEEIWSVLHEFNSTQFVGAVSVIEVANKGPYHRRGTIPYYGPNGINAGVLLLNLTRLRTSTWSTSVPQFLIHYGKKATLYDQDLINVFMHNNPESGYLLPCNWNYHKRQCIECEEAIRSGVALLHGCTRSFVNNNVQPFKAVYSAFKQFELGSYMVEYDLLGAIKRNLGDAIKAKSKKANECHTNLSMFTQRIEEFIRRDKLKQTRY